MNADLIFGALKDLVDALDATTWSAWQGTWKFDPALDSAREIVKQELARQEAAA